MAVAVGGMRERADPEPIFDRCSSLHARERSVLAFLTFLTMKRVPPQSRSPVPQRVLPSSPAGFRSTFDRLPYGCLLFTCM